ncbi:MAG: hypothetical protein J5792_01685 [Bacteroidales bacterium]|nr:hypothetical protein [Bacteroidales bacterium]
MKKKLLFGLILCSIGTTMWAQQKDTVMVQQLPNISKVEVRNNAYVKISSGSQNEIFNFSGDYKKIGEIVNNTLVLDQPCAYFLTLADTSIAILLEDSAYVSIMDVKCWPFRQVDLKDAASMVVDNKETLKVGEMFVRMRETSVVRIKSPFYINRLNLIKLGNAQFIWETDAYHVDYYNYQTIGKNPDTLDNAGFVKITASSGGDTSVFVADKLDTKSDWEKFFKELGGGLYELSNLWNSTPDTSAKKTTASIPAASKEKNKHWYSDGKYGWAFMYWNEDITSFSKKFNNLSVPSNEHITFTSLFAEISEAYRIKQHYLKFGIGMEWDNYHFKNITENTAFDPVFYPTFYPTPDNAKAKFSITYLTLPLGYEYVGRHCSFSLKMIPGYALNSHVKMKNSIRSDNGKYVRKYKAQDWDYVNLFKLDARAELRIDNWGSLYVQPSLLPVLDNNGNKKLYPIRFGYAITMD